MRISKSSVVGGLKGLIQERDRVNHIQSCPLVDLNLAGPAAGQYEVRSYAPDLGKEPGPYFH